MGAVYADKVRAARGVQDALVALAEGIDAILAADRSDWMSWGDSPGPNVARRAAGLTDLPDERKPTANFGSIAERIGDLAYDRQVAAVRLVGEGSSEIELRPPSSEKKQQRRQLEQQRLTLAAHLGEGEDWTESYARGGPMWLYLGNRDLVMSYPADVLRAMVADVEEDSPQQAREMARDVLKEGCADGPGSAGMRTAEGDVG